MSRQKVASLIKDWKIKGCRNLKWDFISNLSKFYGSWVVTWLDGCANSRSYSERWNMVNFCDAEKPQDGRRVRYLGAEK